MSNRCVSHRSSKESTCGRYYTSIAHLPGSLIAQRAMMVISIILISTAFMLALYSNYLIKIGQKYKYRNLTGFSFILSGLCTVGATCWASYSIVARYKYGWQDTAHEHGN